MGQVKTSLVVVVRSNHLFGLKYKKLKIGAKLYLYLVLL